MSNTIDMSRDSLKLIRNLSNISKSIAFKQGNHIRVMNGSETIIGDLTIPESFPVDFNIAEVNKMVGMADLKIISHGDLKLKFDNTHLVFKCNGNSVRYRYTNRAFVEAPDGDIGDPNPDFVLEISEEELFGFLSTASSLKLSLVTFVATEDKIMIRATDPDLGDESNDIEVVVADNTTGLEANEFVILLENLPLFPGDYNIVIDSSGFAMFTCSTAPEGSSLRYMIGVEVAI